MQGRARVYSTEAIALKRMDFGEADRIITMLTPHHGKVRLLAKGVRKSTSRQAGHLELFAHAHVLVARGRELDITTQAATVDAFREIRDDLVRSSQAFHLAELVDAFLQDRDEHLAVFWLLRDSLAALARGEMPPDLVARWFEVQLLGQVGFRPQLSMCLSCERPIVPDENRYSVALGGALCPVCGEREPSGHAISVETLKLLRFLQRADSVAAIAVRVPQAVVDDAERLLRQQIEFVLERRLRAAEFVHRVSESRAGFWT